MDFRLLEALEDGPFLHLPGELVMLQECQHIHLCVLLQEGLHSHSATTQAEVEVPKPEHLIKPGSDIPCTGAVGVCVGHIPGQGQGLDGSAVVQQPLGYLPISRGEVRCDEEEGGAEKGEADAQGPLGLDLRHDACSYCRVLDL